MEFLILFFAFFLTNQRAFVIGAIYPNTRVLLSPAWVEIGLWLLVSLGMYGVLHRRAVLGVFWQQWRRNWVLALFIGLALASMLWSIHPTATAYRALSLLFASLAGAYVGVRYGLEDLLKILFWYGVVVVIFSYELAIMIPDIGRLNNEFYEGAWRGLYWHRNHLGGMTALFNAVFLVRLVSGWLARRRETLLDALLYLLCAGLVFLSDSATGKIVLILINLTFTAALVWRKLADRLKRWHYLALLTAGTAAAGLVLANLGAVFSLFNRSANLTGRTPLWAYLFRSVVSERPWLGHGFGAIWTGESFRVEMQTIFNWSFWVYFADNGYLDMLLHIGWIGLALLGVVLGFMTFYALKYALREKSPQSFLPLLLLVFIFAANIAYSWLFELETFAWFVLVTVLFRVRLNLEKGRA